MGEYISREAAIETIRKAVVYDAIADLVERAINSITAADVREVKRGKWEDVDGMFALCSICKHASGHTPFCAWCGADMREEHDG